MVSCLRDFYINYFFLMLGYMSFRKKLKCFKGVFERVMDFSLFIVCINV